MTGPPYAPRGRRRKTFAPPADHHGRPDDQTASKRAFASRVTEGAALPEEIEMSVLDDYLVDPKLSLLGKARIQGQVLDG
jgi:hypothetical protein